MSRHPGGPASKGSQKSLQLAVANPDRINEMLAASVDLDGDDRITWLSPLASDDYAEYRDGDFLRLLGLESHVGALHRFWPSGGPQWDGLAKTTSGQPILVEAKAHLDELNSSPTGAGEPKLSLIRNSLHEVQVFLGDSDPDWSQTFYQYANRLAHLYFLRERCGLPAWMVFVYFCGDIEMAGPVDVHGWTPALEGLIVSLGLAKDHALSQWVVELFVDVEELRG